ncbi:MAG: hypothetical protein HF982_09870 [Desulfobacteraceae bacterium]|nr:hypothetical protein [Desulfobacteraceae bacterium]MBC2719873.1 hypothetical protein [Desulfobacteraceae bacterium]
MVAAVAISVGLLPGSSKAGDFTAPLVPTFANEIFGTGSAATIVPSGEILSAVYRMAAAPGDGAAFMIEFTLNQGATWGTALTELNLVFNDVDTSGSSVTISRSLGCGVDDSTAKFRVDVTIAITTGDTFTLTYGIDDADPLATAGAAINLAITLRDGLGDVDSAENVDIVNSADGTTETLAASVEPGTCYIDVATANTNFGGTSTDVDSAEVILGSITLANGTAVEDHGLTPWALNAGDALATVILTVTGDFSASLGVDMDGDAATADGLYLDLFTNRAYDAGEEATTLTATTAIWDLGPVATAIAASGATINVHMVVDGITEIMEQTPSATLTVDWTDVTYADESAIGDFRELAKNGTTRNVYNIPGSAGSDQAYIRIYNTSSVAGTVRGTLYDETGLLGTAVLVSDMPAGTTQVFSAANLETLFGTWDGRARMMVDAEIPSMEVMALIRNATGTLTNMSPMAP